MPSEGEVFASVLQALEDVGILSDIVIIGGWAQHLYRQFFKNPPELSALRTLDIDILFRRPPGIRPQADLEAALGALGFEREYGADGSTKFVSREAEVEFLIPEKGSGDDQAYKIEELAIRAQSLRLVGMLIKDPIEVRYGRHLVKVPDPIRFCFNKLLVSRQRTKPEKREKDLTTALELVALLSRIPKWRVLFPNRFEELSKKRRAMVLSLLKEHNSQAAEMLLTPKSSQHLAS